MALSATQTQQPAETRPPSVSPRVPLYQLLADQSALSAVDNERKALEFWTALAGAGFVLVISVLSAVNYFVASDPKFEMALGVVMSLLAAIIGVASSLTLFKVAALQLRQARLSVELLQCGALLLLLLGAVAAAFQGEAALQQRLAGSLLLLNLLLVIERWGVSRMIAALNRGLGFRLGQLVPMVALEHTQGGSDQAAAVSSTELEKLKIGDVIRLEAAHLCPCDGVVLDGLAQLAERRFGGRQTLAFKGKGEEVFAGSLLERGSLRVRVTALPEESTISEFADVLSRNIASDEPEVERQYTCINAACFALLLVAACGAIFFSQRGASLAVVLEGMAALLLLSVIPRWVLFKLAFPARALTRLFLQGVILRSAQLLAAARRIKTVFFGSPQLFAQVRAESVEVLDDRFDKERVLSVAMSLLAASADVQHTDLAVDLRRLIDKPELFCLSDYHSYAGLGVNATIGGAEFSIGTEDFLIERGVLLRAADVLEAQPGREVLYVALDSEIVARLVVAQRDWGYMRELARRIKRTGKRFAIFSAESAERFDAVGRELELEAVDVFPAMNEEVLARKLADADGQAALFINGAAGSALRERAALSIAPFDALRWSFNDADATLAPGNVDGVAAIFEVARRSARAEKAALAILVAAAVCGVAGAWFLGIAAPLIQLLSMLAIALITASVLLI